MLVEAHQQVRNREHRIAPKPARDRSGVPGFAPGKRSDDDVRFPTNTRNDRRSEAPAPPSPDLARYEALGRPLRSFSGNNRAPSSIAKKSDRLQPSLL